MTIDNQNLESSSAGPPAADEAKQFLEALFGQKEASENILVWLLAGKRSTWFSDINQAAAFVHEYRAQDVYAGVCLSPKAHGAGERLNLEGYVRSPSSIVALWADVDLADGLPSKKVRAPDEATARSIFFPEFRPSMIVGSGGGLHAYWILKEPLVLDGEQAIQEAASLARRWNRALQIQAKIRGFDLDSVGDLPRILRVPGTVNLKIPGHPRPVTLIELNEHRYDLSAFRELLDSIDAGVPHGTTRQVVGSVPAPAGAPAATSGIIIGKLMYNPNAEPPVEKFHALCENEPKFLASWNHKRSKREFPDQSPSAYAQSLANYAVMAGWPDQEIANLLIAHRRKWSCKDLKLRDSYIAATIRKARESWSRQIAAEIRPRPEGNFFGGQAWHR